MPAKKGLCWCLGGSAPPEISFSAENGGMTLKPIEVELPMPQDEEELNSMFAELVDELGLDKQHREAMFNLPAEKKWQIYCSKKKLVFWARVKDQEDPNSASWPDYYIERVNQMGLVFFAHDEEEIQNRTKLMDSLKTALRTQPMSFVLRFIELNGLTCLLNFLGGMDYNTSQSAIHTSVIGCIKALLNSTEGRGHVLSHPTCLNVIAQSLRTNCIRTKTAVLEILGAVCLVPGGHRKVLQAMLHYQQYAGERTRFQGLINDLDSSIEDYRDEVNLKTAIMSFINAALKYGPGQKHLEFRLHLRYEFLMLGIQPVIDKLRNHDNATLDRHLDFFEMVRNEDERMLAKKFEVNHVDSKSATAMFDLLRKKLNYSMAYPHLLSVLFHFVQLPFGNEVSVQNWQLIDRIVQQISIQTKEGDPDTAPLEIDVKKLVKQLANETAMKDYQSKMREVQKENDELNSRLNKKERECEIKTEEKDELMTTLNKIKDKMEKETEAHRRAKSQLAELDQQIQDLAQLVEMERAERLKLEHLVKTGSLPDDAKMGFNSAASALAAGKLSNGLSDALSQIKLAGSGGLSGAPSAAPPPPPPPPPSAGPPPPAPPPAPGAPMLNGGPGMAVKKKNIPTPAQPLKSFNWTKLPDNKIKGTLWTDLDDTKLFKVLDLHEFEQNFSAYQRHSSDTDVFKGTPKFKELSVIDGRRAQNCTILLSKLKMSNPELSKAIMSMDAAEDIPKDMCEQLLKFVPTPEEIQMLGEHEHEIEQMAKADRFLFEMSRINHYEQRLKALHYKKKFSERMSDAKPKVEAVLEASKEVYRSRRLRKLLEIVLAYGNYMNRGQRGNASGFKINSLNKIVDTKSSIDRKVTLLHYMVEVFERKFPDLMKLNKEIPHVIGAAKVNLTELESEINLMRTGMKEIETEVQYRKKQGYGNSPSDKFVSVMSDFLSVAAYNFSEVEEQVTEMRERFEKVTKCYGEDAKRAQPEEFFGVFSCFLNSFLEAKIDNDRFVKQKEEEEKRIKMEATLRAEKEKRATKLNITRSSKGKKGSSSQEEEKGEFDDLISALRTGDVFGEDMAKLKKTRRKVSTSSQKLVGDTTRERISIKAT